ncbi:P-loop ATPase, Sll1717 family [Minwuia sp.]|uniref:P-loop ATPase, Sll1717 family n=1 Tax=Minwuia sp. TaxID=2493630 RepID=UPI003A8F2D43
MSRRRASDIPILRQGMTIGHNAAENDESYLEECFVLYPPVEQCSDHDSSAMIVAGRTGSGKTAILQYIESVSQNCFSIDPQEMSMGYISNSDHIKFLNIIDANLDLIFQALWKHVLCIEFIRMKYNIEDSNRSISVFSILESVIGVNKRKKRAIDYLENWRDKFWITVDENVREIVENTNAKIEAEFGSEIRKFRARSSYGRQLSAEKRSELKDRSRKIVNSDQMSELSTVVDMLKEVDSENRQEKYVITIDSLDSDWVDDDIRFELIRALIETLKSMRRITSLKILVALRSDILGHRLISSQADTN